MTQIERGYVAQGYVLPAGWTWEAVRDHRAAYRVSGIYVPLAMALGCVAWGVPMIEGRFLLHGGEEP